MRFGFVAPTGAAAQTVQLAVDAEEHGWDGFFTWDALSIGATPVWDPWALLAAAAVRTSRVRLGAMVFAPARHQPWTFARQVQTVDHLSGGRLVLPVGIGVSDDAAYSRVGERSALRQEPMSARERAERLDDALAVLEAAAGGGPVTVSGTHVRMSTVELAPGTVQRPRVPVWVVGAWPSRRSLARAAAWDGVVLQRLRSEEQLDPGTVRDALATLGGLRAEAGRTGAFDVVLSQALPDDAGAARDAVAAFADAGVTWWVHADWRATTTADQHGERVRLGPPPP